jgi:hypothetical protein
MPVKLNRTAFNHSKQLINRHKAVIDERSAWSEHQLSTQKRDNTNLDVERTGAHLHGIIEGIAHGSKAAD